MLTEPQQPVSTSETLCEAPERFECTEVATHLPCCSSHGKALCCKHYCDFHFVEVHRCSPEDHPTPARV